MIKSYLQQSKINFDQIFITIVKFIAFYIFFIIAAFYNRDIDQIDMKIAFLYGAINSFLFIKTPKGYYNNFKT